MSSLLLLSSIYLSFFLCLPLSDFQSRFIRFSGLAFFLQHTPLPPKLIGFHYGQGWSAHTSTHTLCALSHWGPTPIPTAIWLLSPSLATLHFNLFFFPPLFFLCYCSVPIHPFPLQSAHGWNKVVSRALCTCVTQTGPRLHICKELNTFFFSPAAEVSTCGSLRSHVSEL